MDVHTEANAVPPLDPELEGLLEDLAAVHDPGVDQMLSGLRLIALSRHTADRTQTLIATLAGASDGTNVISAIGLLIARLANPDFTPGLRTLPLDQQKVATLAGQAACFALTDPELHQTASETCAAITGT